MDISEYFENCITAFENTQYPNFYFYHIAPKKFRGDAILSPYAMYHMKKYKMFRDHTDKYRDRLCNGWGIYPDKKPNELTLDEIYRGLIKFRGKNGAKMIYFFKFPPDKSLGPNMANVLKAKDIYQIDLNDTKIKNIIDEIDWGYDFSHTGNKPLTRQHYENISPEKYFKKYDDNGSPLFATLDHIGVAFKNGILPLSLVTQYTS